MASKLKMGTPNRLTKLLVCMTLVGAAYVTVPASSFAQGAAASAPRATKTPVRATGAKKKKPAYSATSARNRRAQLARARAAARARELREVQTPRFRVDEFGREVPDVRAEAAIIYNPVTGEILWEDHAQDQRSIASITKVMTALVFLESGAALSTPVTVQKSDVSHASTTYLRTGFQLTADELLNLLLVGSDNAAARALARISPFGSDGFIQKMNEKARALGLDNTRYADPSGLSAENVSSAFDLARLITYASADERVTGIMRKTSYSMQVGKRTISANSTNQLVKTGDIDVLAGKTGFINRSGYCLATLLRLPQSGQQVAVVVLGAKSNASRFWETRHLFNWMSTRTKALLEGEFQTQSSQQEQ
jgi:D-alanyl-D-alanine endopeptidase (penicillin-binding protein 7)